LVAWDCQHGATPVLSKTPPMPCVAQGAASLSKLARSVGDRCDTALEPARTLIRHIEGPKPASALPLLRVNPLSALRTARALATRQIPCVFQPFGIAGTCRGEQVSRHPSIATLDVCTLTVPTLRLNVPTRARSFRRLAIGIGHVQKGFHTLTLAHTNLLFKNSPKGLINICIGLLHYLI
jgi:hypothetical protein